MRIAIAGCTHGELDIMFEAVAEVDLIICPADFHAVRNAYDLSCMACLPKFKDMRTFWKYFSGERVAPVPTVFVGGNHEMSNHLQELPLGGLVAPNMYYMVAAGVVNFHELRIAVISGVYVEHGYNRPRYERPPYIRNHIKRVNQTRREDVNRFLRLSRPVDVFVSHDWPSGIAAHGDLDRLFKANPFLAAEIGDGGLGNPDTRQLLDKIQPTFWFAVHMHVKYPAIVHHGDKGK